MQIFLKLPTDKTIVYISEPKDKIINIKRHAIQRMRSMHNADISPMMIYSMYVVYNGKCLFDDYLIEDYVVKDTTLHLHFRSGFFPKNRLQEFIVSTDINWHKNLSNVSVFCSPDDTIEYLIRYILEELYTLQKHDLTSNDVIITHNGWSLNPKKQFAEYNGLSSSYFKFRHNDNLFDKTTIIGDFLHQCQNGEYCISVSERKNKKPHLILEKINAIFPEISLSCVGCYKSYNMITPCCRKRICTQCMKQILDNHVCICGTPS